MKNFFSITDISSLFSIKSNLVNTAKLDLLDYMKNMSPVQQKIYFSILRTKLVKMYSIPLKFTVDSNYLPETFTSKDVNKLFTFRVESPEQNHNNGKGPKVKEIELVVDTTVYPCHTSFFSNTLSLLPSCAHTVWIMFYKNQATVLPHAHDDTTILIHILISDIIEGHYSITVGGEQKTISKTGEYFIFCGGKEHSASVTGYNAKFLVFSIEKEDFDKIIHN